METVLIVIDCFNVTHTPKKIKFKNSPSHHFLFPSDPIQLGYMADLPTLWLGQAVFPFPLNPILGTSGT